MEILSYLVAITFIVVAFVVDVVDVVIVVVAFADAVVPAVVVACMGKRSPNSMFINSRSTALAAVMLLAAQVSHVWTSWYVCMYSQRKTFRLTMISLCIRKYSQRKLSIF